MRKRVHSANKSKRYRILIAENQFRMDGRGYVEVAPIKTYANPNLKNDQTSKCIFTVFVCQRSPAHYRRALERFGLVEPL